MDTLAHWASAVNHDETYTDFDRDDHKYVRYNRYSEELAFDHGTLSIVQTKRYYPVSNSRYWAGLKLTPKKTGRHIKCTWSMYITQDGQAGV